MKHDLMISLSKAPSTDGIVACKTISVREKLLRRLFGKKSKITILVPGETVETLSITEVCDGGEAYV